MTGRLSRSHRGATDPGTDGVHLRLRRRDEILHHCRASLCLDRADGIRFLRFPALPNGEVAYAYYAPPPGWLGREVSIQWDGVHVRILDPTTGALLREHRRQAPGHHAIHPADRPARTPPTTLTLLARAVRAGAHIGTLCETIHRRDGQTGVRRILGVLTLVKKHGGAAVEDACAPALELAVADYR